MLNRLRWGRSSTPKTERNVILYGKPGCHLCEDAVAVLEVLGKRYPLRIQEIDIRIDPSLFRLYDIRIPVIVIDGITELEAPITEEALQRALDKRQ